MPHVYQPTNADIAICRSLLRTCKNHSISISPELGYLQVGKMKIMKVTPSQVCLLGGKGNRVVTHTITLKTVIHEKV